MNKILIIIYSLIFMIPVSAQNTTYKVPLAISGRVDTTQNEVRSIYYLLKNYLESSPDSIYNNPYWNSWEKELDTFSNPALFYIPFYNFQVKPSVIFDIWKPFILSIEQIDKAKYNCRIALIKKDDTPDKILTIISINVVSENNKLVLQNNIVDLENKWVSKQYKYIKFVYPNDYQFNDSLANKSIKFCDSICAQLNLNAPKLFTYFICKSPDQLGLLLGYDFFYLNYTTGITNKSRNQIFSSVNNEYYPHEFIHMILSDTNNYRGYIIEEGIASFLGEFNSPKYINQINNLAIDIKAKNISFNLTELLTGNIENISYQSVYPTGSLIVEIVFEKSGFVGLKSLINGNTSTPDEIYKSIKTITGLSKKQLESEFLRKINLYYRNAKG